MKWYEKAAKLKYDYWMIAKCICFYTPLVWLFQLATSPILFLFPDSLLIKRAWAILGIVAVYFAIQRTMVHATKDSEFKESTQN